uniref:PUM-HD domain-containing protein n=1 Tax=Globodera rostochiensis TaxID=31243 RepID=A0A914IDI6_GLORO
MINRFIRNFLNGQHIICKVPQVQAVHVTFLHQCAKNNVCPAAVLSRVARMASSSSSSNRPSHRSKLLDDYHNRRTANLQLADLGKDAVAFALDPHGSRFIEQKLERANPTEKAQLVDALRGHVLTLAQQVYGSHVIEKALKSIINEILAQVIPLSFHKYGSRVIERMLEHCAEQQKRPVLEQLLDNVPTLVTDKYGCFVIQHVIEHGLPEDRARIVRSLQGDIMKYAQDKFASNVIEKCLTCGTADQKRALFDNICVGGPQTLRNARQLMADEFGSHVIEKFFEYGTDDQKAQLVDALRGHVLELALQMYGSHVIRAALKSIIEELTPRSKRPVLEQLLDNVPTLVTDQYGSYVIELVLEHGRPEDRERIVRSLQGDILKNIHRRSICSIIEKCLIFGTTEQKNALIDQVCADDGTGKPPLLQMMKQQFAADVVLKMVDGADSAHRDKMVFAIEEHIPALLKRQQSLNTVQAKPRDERRTVTDKRKKRRNGLLDD